MKHRTTRFPMRRPRALSMSAPAVEIDGMEVIADERVTLFPVTLIEIPPRRAEPDTRTTEGDTHA